MVEKQSALMKITEVSVLLGAASYGFARASPQLDLIGYSEFIPDLGYIIHIAIGVGALYLLSRYFIKR